MLRICVVVDEGHRAGIEDVARSLGTRGMRVEQVLASLGMVTGSVGEDRVPALEAVDGVAAVAEQRRYRLPPPDGAVQ